MDKISEDNTVQKEQSNIGAMSLDMDVVFDEFGDEFDCRSKYTHSQGNIGKATWVSKGQHPYTGMFTGADTGFVRLSTPKGIIPPELAHT